MARNDGIDRTIVRNQYLTASKIANAQPHNEREKESYTNPDIVPQRLDWNVHYKTPTGSDTEMFEQMKAAGVISTRGLKDDSKKPPWRLWETGQCLKHWARMVIQDIGDIPFTLHGSFIACEKNAAHCRNIALRCRLCSKAASIQLFYSRSKQANGFRASSA